MKIDQKKGEHKFLFRSAGLARNNSSDSVSSCHPSGHSVRVQRGFFHLGNPEKICFKAVVGLTNTFDIDIPVQNDQRQNALIAIRWQVRAEKPDALIDVSFSARFKGHVGTRTAETISPRSQRSTARNIEEILASVLSPSRIQSSILVHLQSFQRADKFTSADRGTRREIAVPFPSG